VPGPRAASRRSTAPPPPPQPDSNGVQQLHAGVDTTVIALWLGHERVDTTHIYLHAEMALKQRALERTTPPDAGPGRYKPPDTLLAFLEAL
jgi:hypothetical protein